MQIFLLAVLLGFSLAGAVAWLEWHLRRWAPACVTGLGCLALVGSLGVAAILSFAMMHPDAGGLRGVAALRAIVIIILGLNGVWAVVGALAWTQARLVGDGNWKRCALGLGTQLLVLGVLNVLFTDSLAKEYLGWQPGYAEPPYDYDATPIWKWVSVVHLSLLAGVVIWALWLPIKQQRRHNGQGA